MNVLDGNYYNEVKDHRYRNHPTEKIILGLQDEPKSLRTQYQNQNETQIRMTQNVIKNDNNELIVKNYPKNKNNQLNNNLNLNHQLVLLVNKIPG